MGGQEKSEGRQRGREEIFSKAVRAGKRTYFFDVKSTRNNDHYLTVTESKKVFDGEGKFHFEKHKIFLYREDFEKFLEGFNEAVDYIDENTDEIETRIKSDENNKAEEEKEKEYTDVNFEDLGGI